MRASAQAACFAPTYSPDGDLAYLSDRDGATSVWAWSRDDSSVTRLSDRTLRVDTAMWSPRGDMIAVTGRTGDNPCARLFLLSPSGAVLAGPTSPWEGPDGTDVCLQDWTDDGRAVLCSAPMTGQGQHDCCAYDPREDSWELVCPIRSHASFRGDLGSLLMTMDAGGRLRQRVAMLRGIGTEPAVVLATGSADESVAAVGFAPDRRTVLAISDVGREYSGLVEVPPGQSARWLRTREDAGAETAVLSRNRSTVVIVWNVAGRSVIEVFDLLHNRTRLVADPPADVVWGADVTADGARIAVAATGPNKPPAIWELDVATALWQPVGPSPAGSTTRAEGRSRARLVELEARDGIRLTAWLHEPDPDRRTGACVLSLHGGPEAQERPSHNVLYDSLVDSGIAVLAPNVRGSSGFGRTFLHLDDRDGRFGARADVIDVARHGAGTGLVEPGRLGVLGFSYGGYLALCALQDEPGLFAAGATVAGVVDLSDYVRGTEPWRRPIAVAEFGDPDRDAALLAALSPYAGIDRQRAPVLLVHGDRDRVVPKDHAVRLGRTLRGRNVEARLVLVPRQGHTFDNSVAAQLMVGEVTQWFTRALLPAMSER